jgi:uncharacterized protein
MFHLRSRDREIRNIPPSQEEWLRGELSKNLDENVYLVGLLCDYYLRGLSRMRWGKFYYFENPGGLEGIFYVDVTGLAILTGASDRATASFAEYCSRKRIPISRIIAAERLASGFHSHLRSLSGRWESVRNQFPESGMVLCPESLVGAVEAGLRLATPAEALEVARNSAMAMAEELEVVTEGEDFDRLVRSKLDLIERRRYYLHRDSGGIQFQAYLSASLPEVGQIQGVWVPPEARGRGVATRCLSEMCRRSLRNNQRLVLRVQERNAPALAVYRKIGFKPFLSYLSIWYGEKDSAVAT